MSLRAFLPVSASMSRADDGANRFRPADPGLVPNFSSGAGRVHPRTTSAADSPGRGEAPVAAAIAGTTLAPAVTVVPEAHASVATPASGMNPSFTGSVASPALPAGGASTAAAVPKARRLPRWIEQVLLVFMRPGNRRRGTRVVQSELRFDTVRVARNDLATADVEVVLVKPAGRPARMSAECRERVLRLWWEEGSRRLRRLGHLLF